MIRLRFALAALVAAGSLAALPRVPARAGEDVPAAALQLSGPFASGNLAIYLVRDPKRVDGKPLLTLDEALEQKKVVVHETKQVNQLSIDNPSTETVFLQAGDIVKGGQQDRVLGFDLVVPPGTKGMPLACFCVEAGRWAGRAGEAAGSFARSKECLVSNDLKVAARAQASQQEVWSNVAKAQAALGEKIHAEVKDKRSASSLQLTLENQKLNEVVDANRKYFDGLLAKEMDGVSGCVVAINGTVIGADLYASPALFRKLWPKLLKAAVVESVAEAPRGRRCSVNNVADAKAFLVDAAAAQATAKPLPGNATVTQKYGPKVLLFETRAADYGDVPLRSNFLTRPEAAPCTRGKSVPQQQQQQQPQQQPQPNDR